MEKNKFLSLSNSLQNLLFPPGKYTSAQLLNLTPYFSTGVKLSLQQYQKLMRQLFDIDQEKLWWIVKAEYGQVDAKLIGREKREIGGYNEGIKNHAVTKDNNLTSPRSKTTRALYMSNQQTIILHYIKQNLMNFIKILSNEPNSQDPMLQGQDLQPLNVLFKVDRNKKFASFLSIFNKSLKLKASVIAKQLQNRIQISQQQLVSLQGVSFSVTVKEQIHCRGKDLRIIGCQDSQIFIDSSVRSLYIVNSACQRIAFIDKCEKIFFTTATNLLRICNTVDSSIYYYGTSPIILTGDNRSVSIGPNNCPSKDLKVHVKNAGIQLSQKYYDMFQQILSKGYNKQKQNTNTNISVNYTKMKLQEFDLLVMPIKSEEDMKKQKENIEQNILAPIEYIKELQNRNLYYNSFKTKIGKSKLSSQMSRNLHSALQGNFKQWLTAKGYTKNLNDLVKMLDKNEKR